MAAEAETIKKKQTFPFSVGEERAICQGGGHSRRVEVRGRLGGG